MKRFLPISITTAGLLLTAGFVPLLAGGEPGALQQQVVTAMRKAATYYHAHVASHGGYVYYYSPDLERRWGEGEATRDQIWVQPPGTPTVGLAYLAAYRATGESLYLDAARKAAEALVYGQLESGGWTNCVDFNPEGQRTARYRNGRGRGKNNSSLDDGQTQSAIRLLVQVDQALEFKHARIHEAARIALSALLEAQFPNGAFPQVWTGPVPAKPVLKASYPDYDWRTEGRVKEYWDRYTLNDNLAGYVAQTLRDAHGVYEDDRYRDSLLRLGGFLILAQMPDPQPAWAQQYGYDMHPIWARRFEPAALSGWESQDAMETLLEICRYTGDRRFLAPIPRALAYLKKSLLPDGRLARYYELRTNRPLYMVRRGNTYTLTYDDSRLPGHYGWKMPARLDEIEKEYRRLKSGREDSRPAPDREELEAQARRTLDEIDTKGRWISTATGQRLVGQPKFQPGTRFLSSEVFSRNLETLSRFLESSRQE